MKQNSAAATPFDAEFSERKPLHAFQKVLQVFALASLLISTGVSAEKVQFPGAKAEGYAHMPTVSATLEMPETATRPVPAVVVLHGSGGIDGRGEFHAKALRKAGFATLEVFMFEPGNRFKEGHISTLTHAYGALAYLAGRSDIIPTKIGAIGFSWGGNLSLLAASDSVHRSFFPSGSPRFAAHAPFYAVWWQHSKRITDPSVPAYGAYNTLTGAPVMLFAGGKDDYGPSDSAQTFLNQLPQQAKALVSLQFYPAATHGWDSPPGRNRTIQDSSANEGTGGPVRFWPDSAVAEDSRAKMVTFFTEAFAKP